MITIQLCQRHDDGDDVMSICARIFLVLIAGWNDIDLYHRIIWRAT
jgi:hypothetical protein